MNTQIIKSKSNYTGYQIVFIPVGNGKTTGSRKAEATVMSKSSNTNQTDGVNIEIS